MVRISVPGAMSSALHPDSAIRIPNSAFTKRILASIGKIVYIH